MTMGEKIQAIRKSKGMTQEELASRITVSRQAVSRWELDEVLPDTDNLLQLCKVLNASADFLLDDNAEMENVTPPAKSPAPQERQRKLSRIIILAVYLAALAILTIVSKSVVVLLAALCVEIITYAGYLAIRALLRRPKR